MIISPNVDQISPQMLLANNSLVVFWVDNTDMQIYGRIYSISTGNWSLKYSILSEIQTGIISVKCSVFSNDRIIISWGKADRFHYQILIINDNMLQTYYCSMTFVSNTSIIVNRIGYNPQFPNRFDVLATKDNKQIVRYRIIPNDQPIVSIPTEKIKDSDETAIISPTVIIVLSVFGFVLVVVVLILLALTSRQHDETSEDIVLDEIKDHNSSPHRIDATRTLIMGKYEISGKINREEAGALVLRCGIYIDFPPEKNKIPYFLGEGCNGRGKLCRDVNTDIFYGVKKSKDPKEIRTSELEAMTLKELKHQNIVRFMDSVMTKDSQGRNVFYIFTEVMLMDCSMFQKFVNESTMKQYCMHDIQVILDSIFYGTSAGIKYMHEIGYYHRDIKPSNILLGRERY